MPGRPSRKLRAVAYSFNVWWMNPDGSKKENLAGSNDAASAMILAGQVFVALQEIVQKHGDVRLEVFDASNVSIAFIGRGATQQGSPAVAPTLSSLVPDSSGNWAAEVQLHGSGFTASSQVFANSAQITPVTFVSASELRVVVGASASGAYQVTVREKGLDSNMLVFTAL